jgi:PAS domain S-box-containing protein
MNDSLHTVLIDDNPDDRALVIRELRREFPMIETQEISDPASFAKALESEAVDLAITDYQLRWSDGLAVLRKVKSRWPDCSVIMFTGSGCEEVAVEAMKAGLDDYLLKSPSHYAQLPGMARSALKLAEHRRRSQQRDKAHGGHLFDGAPVGLFRALPQGDILHANLAFREMLCSPDEATLLATNLSDLHVEPDDFHAWQLCLRRDGLAPKFITKLRRFDGEIRWIETSARLLEDSRTGELVCEGSMEDVSDRKNAEGQRERRIVELEEALARAATLRGLLTICASCKKIRDEKGGWNQVESFIEEHSHAVFTHSLCQDCVANLYPDLLEQSGKNS